MKGAVAAPLKIAQLSDLHTHGLRRRERRLLEILATEKPDMIIIVGDSLANMSGNYQMCGEVYRQLHAPLGVWFVRANWENMKPFHRERAFYQEVGARFLLNANEAVRPDVWMIGLDDPYSGNAKLETASQVFRTVRTLARFSIPRRISTGWQAA